MHVPTVTDPPPALSEPGRGLGWLLGSTGPDEFFAEIWDKRAHHVARSDPFFYDDLVGARDVEEIANIAVRLGEATRGRPFIELVGGEKSAGTVQLRDTAKSAQGLWRAYGKGASILVQMAQRYWPPLARFCSAIEAELRSPIDATLICTPAGSQAFGRHFDRLHSLVIQISGRKHWRLFGTAQQHPVQDLPPLPFETVEAARDRLARWAVEERSEAGRPTTLTMRAGDFLYIPRGQYHEVWTDDEPSAHITLAVRPLTYVDLIAAALGRFAEFNPECRASLPIATQGTEGAAVARRAGALVADFASKLDACAALRDLENAYQALLHSSTPPAASEDVAIGASSEFEHVSSSRPRLIRSRGHADFYYGDRLFRLPDRAAPALDFIAKRARFRLDEVPGLTPEGALVLARRLVRANVLRPVVHPHSAEKERCHGHQSL